MNVPVLRPPIRAWTCSACPAQHRAPGAQVPMHRCAGLGGITAPMVPAGTASKVELREREDYVGDELVQLHRGRPVMSVQVTRDDGTDAVVFAPTARARGRAS